MYNPILINTFVSSMNKTISDPNDKDLRDIIGQMPNAHLTEWGNYSIQTQVTARSSQSTYIVANQPKSFKTIDPARYKEIEDLQQAFINNNEMVIIHGWIGCEHPVSVPVNLWIEKKHANIAAMQRHLFFNNEPVDQPLFNIYYTPNLPAPDFPDQRLIVADMDSYTTRIMGTDYFGECKKAGLRMWNKWVYDRGGLALHAGCKIYFDKQGKEKSVLIIGLSGTGKTTTTFSDLLHSLPIQDDFCALFPRGIIYASENGCFAKTFQLNKKNEPSIYEALKKSNAFLENVYVDENGRVDYYNGVITTNSRGTFPLFSIPHRAPYHLPPVSHIIILNRNQSIMPAITRLTRDQAAIYFMLGETTGTSAGGKAEAGKALRIPGTNPFFFDDDSLQGLRFQKLLESMPNTQVILMNTGHIGGNNDKTKSMKVTIQDSSRIIEAPLRGEIWGVEDSGFCYALTAHENTGVNHFFL